MTKAKVVFIFFQRKTTQQLLPSLQILCLIPTLQEEITEIFISKPQARVKARIIVSNHPWFQWKENLPLSSFSLLADLIMSLKDNPLRVLYGDDCQLYHMLVLDRTQEAQSELKSNTSPFKLDLIK